MHSSALKARSPQAADLLHQNSQNKCWTSQCCNHTLYKRYQTNQIKYCIENKTKCLWSNKPQDTCVVLDVSLCMATLDAPSSTLNRLTLWLQWNLAEALNLLASKYCSCPLLCWANNHLTWCADMPAILQDKSILQQSHACHAMKSAPHIPNISTRHTAVNHCVQQHVMLQLDHESQNFWQVVPQPLCIGKYCCF